MPCTAAIPSASVPAPSSPATNPAARATLEPGDRLLLYTDGVTEAFNSADEAYGVDRLLAEVRAQGEGAATALVERICRSVTSFAGSAPQSDDITLTVLTRHAS